MAINKSTNMTKTRSISRKEVSVNNSDFDSQDESSSTRYYSDTNSEYSPNSVKDEMTKASINITDIEDAFEYLLKALEPILPAMDNDNTGNAVKEQGNSSQVVRELKMMNERLYNIKYNLQQLPNYIQL